MGLPDQNRLHLSVETPKLEPAPDSVVSPEAAATVKRKAV